MYPLTLCGENITDLLNAAATRMIVVRWIDCVLDLRGMEFGKEMDQSKIPESSVVIIIQGGPPSPARGGGSHTGLYRH